MAFCYLHVVSHGLTRVILPEPILDRSGFKGGIPIAGEKGERARFPIPSNLQVGAVQFFRDDVAGLGRRLLQFVFCDEIIQIFNRPPFVKQRFHRVYPVLL